MTQSQITQSSTFLTEQGTVEHLAEHLIAKHEPENNHPEEAAEATDALTKCNISNAGMNRRSILRGMGMAAVATAATTMVTPETVDAEASTQSDVPMMRSPRNATPADTNADLPSLPSLATIALNRMGFGPRTGDIQAFNALGNTADEQLTAYVDEQLSPHLIDDSVCDARIAAYGFQTINLSLEELWRRYMKREGDENKQNDRSLPVKEIEALTFLRAVYSKRQLTEVLADHWHNHFNVNGRMFPVQSIWVHYDRDIIRKHMLGNFREFLEAVAKSPAMLYYLDNDANTGADPNENFARELFELHGMGAENYLGVRASSDPDIVDENGQRVGYIDNDVYGATTAFTGWQIDWDKGTYIFNDSDHFPFQKIVLGKVLPSLQGEKDGHDVLDLIADHPGTARYVCRRLCRRFISDNPPESVVQAAADVFYANRTAPDQLKQVMRTILLSPEFRTTWAAKVKRPFEFAVSAMRALNLDFSYQTAFYYAYITLGQPLFAWGPPDGYPDVKEDWTTTMPMLQRWRLIHFLLAWRYGGDGANKQDLRVNLYATMPTNITLPYEIIDYWSHRILGRTLPDNERDPIVNFLTDGRNANFALPAETIETRLSPTVALILMAPIFQWR